MFQVFSCCEVFKGPFVAVMLFYAYLVKAAVNCFFYNNVGLIQYCEVIIGRST